MRALEPQAGERGRAGTRRPEDLPHRGPTHLTECNPRARFLKAPLPRQLGAWPVEGPTP